MTTLALPKAAPVAHEAGIDLPKHVLRETAARYIFDGHDTVPETGLLLIDMALRGRMVRAERQGFAPSDVIRALLRPLFDNRQHCGCAACQARCPVCRNPGEPVKKPAEGWGII